MRKPFAYRQASDLEPLYKRLQIGPADPETHEHTARSSDDAILLEMVKVLENIEDRLEISRIENVALTRIYQQTRRILIDMSPLQALQIDTNYRRTTQLEAENKDLRTELTAMKKLIHDHSNLLVNLTLCASQKFDVPDVCAYLGV